LVPPIFDWIDSNNINLGPINPFKVLRNAPAWRKYFLFLAFLSAGLWIVMGFDSTMDQLVPFINNAIPLVLGQVSLETVITQSNAYYGVGNHLSAPVIYGLCFYFLSEHFELIGIRRSYNFLATTLLSLGNIGFFEIAWNQIYSRVHNQWWASSFIWKQGVNTIQFISWAVISLVVLLYLVIDKYQLNLSKTTISLFVISIILWTVWVYYPYETTTLHITTEAGVWSNSQMFPQTFYAIDINPLDNYAIGTPFYAPNTLVHLLNVITKIFTASAFLSLAMVRRAEQ